MRCRRAMRLFLGRLIARPGSGVPAFVGFLPDLAAGAAVPLGSPSPPGTPFYAPIKPGLTPSGSGPFFCNITRIGDNNNRLVATGYQWTSDTTFTIYGSGGTTTATIEAPTTLANLTNLVAGLKIVGQGSGKSLYMVWPQNSFGYGYPFLINRPELGFIVSETTGGPNPSADNQVAVLTGDVCHCFAGNNLSDNGAIGGNCFIWCVKSDGSGGQFITPSYVNPHELTFTLPALASGTYKLYAHNGHGGKYGWSDPLTVVVYQTLVAAGLDYGTVYNLATVDATNGVPSTGTDGKDVSLAINTILTTIDGGTRKGTINFSGGAGNYYVGSKITIPSNCTVWMEGVSGVNLRLKYDNTGGTVFNDHQVLTDPGNLMKVTDISIDTITFVGNGTGFSFDGLATGAAGIYGARLLNNVTIDTTGVNNYCCAMWVGKVTNCTFKGQGISLVPNNTTYGWVDTCTFLRARLDPLAGPAGPIVAGNCSRLAITNCTSKDLVDHGIVLAPQTLQVGTFSVAFADSLTGLNYFTGQTLIVVPRDTGGLGTLNPADISSGTGTVNSYVSGTGALSINITSVTHGGTSHTVYWIDGLDYQRGMGRFFSGGNGGATYLNYIARNNSIWSSPPPVSNQQRGEQIAVEANLFATNGDHAPAPALITAATATSFTFTGLGAFCTGSGGAYMQPAGRGNTLLAYVQNGKGFGQTRLCLSISGDTVTVPAWDVIPDTGSTIAIFGCCYKVSIFDNTLQAIANLGGNASCGTRLEGAIECVIDGNTVSQESDGFTEASNADGAVQVGTNAFNIYQNNTVSGILNSHFRTVAGGLGVVRRNNTFSGSSPTSAATGWLFNSSGATDIEVWEGNTATDEHIGVDLSGAAAKGLTSIILDDSTFSLGAAASSGSIQVNNPLINPEVNTGNVLATNLLAAYLFPEGTGSTSRNSVPATLKPNQNYDLLWVLSFAQVTWTTVGGVSAISLGYNIMPGDGSGLPLKSDITFDGTVSYTLAFRAIKASNAADNAGIVCGLGGTSGFVFLIQGTGIRLRSRTNSTDYTWTGTTDWSVAHDVMIVYNHATLKMFLYVDAVQDTTGTGGAAGWPVAGNADADITIRYLAFGDGTQLSPAFSLVGTLVYFYAYNKALTSGDASTIHSTPYVMLTGGVKPPAQPVLDVPVIQNNVTWNNFASVS